MAISVGTKAPDFTLKSKNAEGVSDISLSSNIGQKNTVILFSLWLSQGFAPLNCVMSPLVWVNTATSMLT